ncbi:hypothetical protein Q4579_04825 [Photobacterium sp. 1_MG-2023]|nr:hypothetical protein [Photobacterium sp. 1_MG-2023]
MKIDVQSIRLTLDAETNHGIRQYRFPLVLISEQTIAPQNGLFLKAPAQTAYTFKMAEEARLSFGEVQAALQRQNPHRFEFSVDADFEPIPESIETATLSVLLKLSDEKDYLTLVEDAVLNIKG